MTTNAQNLVMGLAGLCLGGFRERMGLEAQPKSFSIRIYGIAGKLICQSYHFL